MKKECECGCGKEVKEGRRFVRGHFAKSIEGKLLHEFIHRGKKRPEETGRKISEAKRGRPLEEEHKQKLRGRVPWNKGKKGLQVSWNKGRTLSEATRKKISESRIGKYAGGNNPMFGKSRPDLIKRNIETTGRPAWNKGLKGCFSEEVLHKWTISRSGTRNHQWKGGISKEPYCIEFTKELKDAIKERDEYTCKNPYCIGDNYNLVIHHINYIKKDCDWRNLITVCNSCNSKANNNRDYWQGIYSNIIGRLYENL